MSNLILKKGFGEMDISLASEAYDVKTSLLNNSKTMLAVNDGFEATMVADSQRSLRHLISQIEESRKAAKAPILKFGKMIDGLAKEFIEEVKEEETRIGRLLGAFQIVERDKKLAAERQARIQEQKVMAGAAQQLDADIDYTELMDDAQAQIATLRKEAAAKHEAVAGVKVRTTTKFEIVDEAETLKARPDLFSLNESKIRAALKTTKTIPGIKVWEETKSY